MFIKSQNDSTLDQEIAVALEELKTVRDDPDKYAAAMERVARLQKLKTDKVFKLPLDTMLVCATNIFGVLWLARYERENVIKSPNAFRTVLKVK